ncbi:MAG TPA: hypothetical protein VG147_14135 [Solirubrobacteraceae bacterium]|jgi:hypothetical protein|nr:hypothetical protein [Solirubrobacteraceae bacterium]
MRVRVRYLIAAVGVLLLVALPATAGAASPPGEPKTEPVEFTSTGVKLKGALNPEGVPTYYYFMYAQPGDEECAGPLPCGATTPRGGPLEGSVPQAVSAEVTGLRPGQTYIYWLFAENEAGKRHSSEGQFTVPTAVAEAPVIESESVVHVTATGARLAAVINPEDAEKGASYQFQLVANPSEYISEFACPSAWKHTSLCLLGDLDASAEGLPIDETGPGVEGQAVGLNLTHVGVKLEPGTTYHYRVIAARSKLTEDGFGFEGPIVYGSDETFTTLPAKAPVIESVRVSHLTKTDATIDTEGLETEYAFHMISSPCSKKGAGCELIVPIELPCGGKLFGSFVPQTVSLDLNSAGVELGEGEYIFGVTASNEGGETTASGGMFEALEEPVAEPLKHTVAPGPVSNEPEVPLTGGQHSTSDGGGSPAPAGGSTSAAVSSKPAHGKPSTKHGKRHKHKHHHTKAAKHLVESKKR